MKAKNGLKGRLERLLVEFEKTDEDNVEKKYTELKEYMTSYSPTKKELESINLSYQRRKKDPETRARAYLLGRLIIEFGNGSKTGKDVIEDIFYTMMNRRIKEEIRCVCLETLVSVPQYNGAKYEGYGLTEYLVDFLCKSITNKKESMYFKMRSIETLAVLYDNLKKEEAEKVKEAMNYIIANKREFGKREVEIAKEVSKKK